LFEDQAKRAPDDVAVVFEEEQLTYGDLNRRANQLAHYLQSIGVGPEVFVGVAMERSLEMIVGLYSILKAGGAYVPIDPTYPAERITHMLEDANVPVLLTQAKLLDRLSPHEAQVIRLDTDWDDLMAGQSTENPVCKATLENLAYMIYTSGSTGKPKGVMNAHGGILNRLLWMQEAYHLTACDRVLQKTPFSFDVSVWEFFWPLMFGARLVVARPEGHKDSDYLVQTIIDEQITTMHFVPSMLQLFLAAKDLEKCDSLRQVICSGEALPLDLQNRFFDRLGAKLHNLYGPTEAAVDVTYWECQRGGDLRIVPIGRPVSNTQMYVLDRYMQPVPVGVSGELHIGGVQVARGYLNRAELTAEKFISDPFSDNPEARLYKTGDLARYLPDGNIEYLGRSDYQVKIRGNRIELGEIESMLSQYPAVRDALVLVREDVPDDKRLVAYIVPGQNQKLSVSELREYVKQTLPDFMVPSHFVTLDAFPLTPNQKIDRKALPRPDQVQIESETAYVPPKNELQQTIVNIWQELLHVPMVGMDDNFFELGGHSLLIVRAYYRLCEVIDRELSITDMFRFPTVSTLAEYLSQDSANGGETAVRKITERAEARRAAIVRQRQVRQGFQIKY
jgi:amino acid adenylation domain-containing protein